jgi:hypothetical protein
MHVREHAEADHGAAFLHTVEKHFKCGEDVAVNKLAQIDDVKVWRLR